MFLQQHFPEHYLQVKNGNTEPEKLECPIRHRIYYNYFKDNFNYGFGRPRTDVCGTCAELELKVSTEKNAATSRTLQTELQLHKCKAKAYYNKLKNHTVEAEQDEEVDVLAIDFQQNIPYPHLPVGEIFYMRQLWVYNFCIYSAKNQKSTMYMWPETMAKRGSNEVVSCLQHYIQNKLSPGVKKIKLYSNGCRGQNHNHTIVQYLFTLVKTGQLDSIEHHLPIRGHSFLPCDGHFATTERQKRRIESVDWYPEWIDLVEKSFEVVRVQQDLISDHRNHLQQFFKKSVKRGQDSYKVSEYKLFVYSNRHPNEVEVSTNMMALNRMRFGLLKPNVTPSLTSTPCYSAPLPVKPAKKKDIEKLKKYLKVATRDLVDQLTTSNNEDSDNDNSDYED